MMKTKTISQKIPSRVWQLPTIIFAAVIALCAAQTKANTVALDFTGGTRTFAPSDLTSGWAFSLTVPVVLTDLGIWDGPNDDSGTGDGLAQSHLISIWTDSGVLVTSAIVPAAGGTLLDDFRYVSIAPMSLPAGDYVIGAFYEGAGPDPLISNGATVTTASGVGYNGSRSASGNAFPSFNAAERPNGYFGPNFQFINVPEPGVTVLLLLGLVGGLSAQRMFRATTIRFLQD